MATPAQIEANRRNAQNSTGARTPEGKARTRRNATRHGLCSTIALMEEEKGMEEDFQRLLADLREEHQPDGPTEDILVYKMAESFFFTNRAQVHLAEQLTFNDHEDNSKQIALMLRYHTTADRAFNRNLSDLRKLQKERRKEEIGFVSQDPVEQPEAALATQEKPAQIALVVVSEPAPFPIATEIQRPEDTGAVKAGAETANTTLQPVKKVA